MNLVDGEVTVITGGAAGIGTWTARRAGEEGARVVVGDIDVEGGTETVDHITDVGGETTFVEADMSKSVEPMPGRPDGEEIANAVLFLASNLASRVTGTTLPVDGCVL